MYRGSITLRVLMNDIFIGILEKKSTGAISFSYDQTWLDNPNAIPVSLSLPLSARTYAGARVSNYFDNLLPDVDYIRKTIAAKVGAQGTDAFSLLEKIGGDCVGALQFLPEHQKKEMHSELAECSDSEIAHILRNLTISPLGIESDGEFRISLAGAQEKTALHQKDGKWFMPKGTMPTTHILKPQIGKLGNGVDLSQSVENEYFCLKFLELFGIPVNKTQIYDFDDVRALVVERFDRRFAADGRLIRLPQEDLCQALSIPSTLKYQNQGGPGIVDVLKLLNAGDNVVANKKTFLNVQILFWLMSATDGHAKNFSIYLLPSGRYHLTPIYDVLSTQPVMDRGELQSKEMKLAMSVGNSNHYKLSEITGRHFVQSAEKSGIVNAQNLVSEIIEDISDVANNKLMGFCDEISDVVPDSIVKPIVTVFEKRLKTLI